MRNQLVLVGIEEHSGEATTASPQARRLASSRRDLARSERARAGADAARQALRDAVRRTAARELARRSAREAALLAALNRPRLPIDGPHHGADAA